MGIFYVPADVAQVAPGWMGVLVFALTGLALAPVALAFAALGKRFDEDGGPVVFARAAFGATASFLVGWIAYVSAVASAAAVMSGLAAALAPQLGLQSPLGLRSAAAVFATALALVCALGIVVSARAWTALTVLKLVPLAALVGAVVVFGAPAPASQSGAVALAGSASLLHAALRVAFTYQGFEIVPVIASQVRAPARAVPMATLGALALAGLLYLALHAACVFALPGLALSPAPLADAAQAYGGPGLARLVSAGTTLSALGIAMGMMVTTPRYLSALAKGDPLAFGLERMAPSGVPLRALGVTWALVAALVLSSSRGDLFDLASVAVLVQYVVTALALAALARRGERGLGPRHLWLALPAAVVGIALAWGATRREWEVGGLALALGVVLRWARTGFRPTARPGSDPLS